LIKDLEARVKDPDAPPSRKKATTTRGVSKLHQLMYELSKLVCVQGGKGMKNDQKGQAFMIWLFGLTGITEEERNWIHDTHKALKPIVGNRYFVNHSNCKLVYALVPTYLAFLEYLQTTKTPQKLNRLESSVKAGLKDTKVIAMIRAAAILATQIELPTIYASKKMGYLKLQKINYYSTVFKCLELWSTEDGANQLFTLPGTILGLIYQTPVEDPYMKRIVEPQETDTEVLKILRGCVTKGAVVWATHASGHIDPETGNDKIVSSAMTKRSCEENSKGTGKSNNDDCERIIANMRYLGVQARNLRVEGKNALVMSKINNPLAFLKEGKLGVHSKLFAYIRLKARQDLKKAGTKKDVWRRIAEEKVKYSEPAPCTELQARRKATREQAMAMHQATAADYIQQLVDPYLDAEGDIAKKSAKELDAMIAAWKLVPKIVNHQGHVWPGATFPKEGTGKPDKNGKCGIKKKDKVANILSVLHSYLDATRPRAT